MKHWMDTDCPYCGHTNTTWVEVTHFDSELTEVVRCGERFNSGCGKPYVVFYKPELCVRGINAIKGVG